MSHLTYITDHRGDVVDMHYYCSDGCAMSDPLYAGWNGCYELHSAEWCGSCGVALGYWCQERDEWILPEEQDQEAAKAMYGVEIQMYEGKIY